MQLVNKEEPTSSDALFMFALRMTQLLELSAKTFTSLTAATQRQKQFNYPDDPIWLI